jgi:hypothetical protein
MFGTYFYNETFKRAVSIFGTLFNNISIKKTKADGTVLAENKVPISYGPKQKFLQRLADEPDFANRTAISLPRITFEMSGIEYDVSRQQNKLIRQHKDILEAGDVGKRGYQYNPVPYNINFTLSILAKNVIDALQITEQILPYFQPEYTVSMKMVDAMSEVRDVPIVLTSVAMEDTYEGSFEERRVIEYTLEFQMKLYFFGPVYTGEIIKHVIERDYISSTALGSQTVGFTTSEINEAGLVKEVKHYEAAFQETTSTAVSSSTTVAFSTAINSKISVNDEIFGTNLATNPTVSAIAENKLSITTSAAVTLDAATKLKFVGSVDPSDTFVVAETVTFYDDGAVDDYASNLAEDQS